VGAHRLRQPRDLAARHLDGVSPKHLQRYLDEFSYRFDRRWREGELFGFVLRRQPRSYRRLVAEGAA
jgi:hypothetical protein